ncbi:UTP--glucose-1-phosphate uridylyltransferase [Fodinicola feengrottensis]|uniref:UTP--glucose-1-phosphate uridylyltransferase n=1 Tax=Fodinicola feengrottensis TaxID=435914 RepID=A0ABP4V0A9_9ACTN|nr:UTP--glucose-1-phosphate uridylyltransferase [Fodinicola feengrottensis]
MPETRTHAGRATKAVIPAAGLGTRFLPATKAVPKELLPVVDKPALQYVVEEAAAAGLTDVLLVTGRGKSSMVDHFDRKLDLEQSLAESGKYDLLEAIRRPCELASIHTSRQPEALGLGHAVHCAAAHVGQQPFAVMLGDDLIDERDPLLPRMLDLQAQTGGIVVGLIEVPKELTKLYGIATATLTDEPDVVAISELVEKPEPDEAPSNLAVIGRYVLPGEIFEVIARTKPGRGGEIQLTDAMATMAAEGTPVHGVLFSGRRYDTGDRQSYLRSVVKLAADRDDLGPDFRDWLKSYVDSGFQSTFDSGPGGAR